MCRSAMLPFAMQNRSALTLRLAGLLDRDTAGRKPERQTYYDGKSPEHHPELSCRDGEHHGLFLPASH